MRNLGSYDWLLPPRIVFGWGRRREVGGLARTLGRRAFLVTGSRTLERQGAIQELVTSLHAAQVAAVSLTNISREPEVGDVDDTARALIAHQPSADDFVIALGGGSAIDLAKAVAAMATNRAGSGVRDYLEGVGTGQKIEHDPLPVLAMPTTSGTGSEATKNSVISSYDPPFKKSLRSERMIPRIVLVDPELTVNLPATITAHSGLDAITQLIESYVTRKANAACDALCLAGLEGALPALLEAVANPSSRPARERMSHAALFSGMALANSGLGLAHGVAAALGVRHRVPHGLACAVMLPAAMRVNREVASARIARLAPLLTGRSFTSESAAVDAAIAVLESAARTIGIPARLSELGVTSADIPLLVKASHGNSLSGNPRELTDEELERILEGML